MESPPILLQCVPISSPATPGRVHGAFRCVPAAFSGTVDTAMFSFKSFRKRSCFFKLDKKKLPLTGAPAFIFTGSALLSQ